MVAVTVILITEGMWCCAPVCLSEVYIWWREFFWGGIRLGVMVMVASVAGVICLGCFMGFSNSGVLLYVIYDVWWKIFFSVLIK